MDNIVYAYDKKRYNYGRQPLFCCTKPEMIDSIDPNPTDQKQYCLRNPVNSEAQVFKPKAEHEVNTIRVNLKNRGINHAEGGWPKEVHCNNEEEVIRYRRRIEREDDYVHAILTLTPKMEKIIRQNNAIDVYQHFFHGMKEVKPVEKPSVKINNLYRDPDQRPVSDMSWTIEDDPKLAVSYCCKTYPVADPVNNIFTCFIWDLENPDTPAFHFEPPTACWKIACAPNNPAIITAGLGDGTVCVFDIRAEREPVSISPPHTAHSNPVSALLYIHSRSGNEFFTGSSDGQCMWHDIRNLSQPTDSLIMSVNPPPGEEVCLSNSDGISSLQFDRSFPTRFLCGTDTGLVINVNRKGKTHRDMLSGIFKAHDGPVNALHRSPCTSKMFITCGDWTVHIWSDDIKTSPIIRGMPHRYKITDVVWAPQRFSGYMTVAFDGKFRYWDILRRFKKPVISLTVSKNPLLRIMPHEDGRLIAIGGKLGVSFLLGLSEDLVVSGSKDKQLMIQLYERESRREHILESRVKEIRLKLKAEEEAAANQTEEVYDEEAVMKAAEDEYRKGVLDEIRRAGIPPASTTAKLGDAMRYR